MISETKYNRLISYQTPLTYKLCSGDLMDTHDKQTLFHTFILYRYRY